MAIDKLTQLSAAIPKPTSSVSVPRAEATQPERQALPGSGKALPADERSAVDETVGRMNEYVQNFQRDLQFRVDEDSQRIVVTVLDSKSGEVIRQIPSEEVLAVARSLEQGQGLIFSDKV